MDKTILQFENLNLDDTYTVKYLKKEPFNTQKCYLSTNSFKTFNICPGHPIFLTNDSQTILCRLYSKPFLADNIIEFDKSVYFSNAINAFDNKSKLTIKTCPKACEINNIDVEVVFDTLKDLIFWHNKQEEFSSLLKNHVLSYFIIANECHINLENMTTSQRFGIHKLLLKSKDPTSIGKVHRNTNICISKFTYKTKHELEHSILPPLYGMESHIDRLTEIVNINKKISDMKNKYLQPSKQILLVGPSGCGKSSLVISIAQKTNTSMISIFDHNISQKEPGETESVIRNLFNDAFICAKITGSCIINLEEISNLCPKRQNSSSHVQRAATQILSLLDEAQNIPGIIVIATTNKPEHLDPSIRRHSRLETEIFIAPPTESQRALIVENLMSDLKLNLSDSCLKTLSYSIASMTPGYVGADLKLIFQKINILDMDSITSMENDSLTFWTNKFRSVISAMKPASLKGTLGTIIVGQLSYDSLVGMDNVKKSLEMAILWPLQHGDAFKRMGIAIPKGVLLYGPPGCGKTSLVKALINMGSFSLLSISAAELYSPFVGDAERLIVKLFDRARQNSPCIIFIDEIDSLTGSRGSSNETNSDVQERIIASLLTQMDGIGHHSKAADFDRIIDSNDGVIVIGATNRPDMIDPALLRPGRFDKHIYVPPPNEESRLSILKSVTKKMPIDFDVDLVSIASKTGCFSGADIKNICTEAALCALTDDGIDTKIIKNAHFQKALFNSRPSLSQCQIDKYGIFS